MDDQGEESLAACQESGISQEQASNDVTSLASLGIPADPSIQSKTLLRKNLQAAYGPRPRITKEGVSNDVLRLVKVVLLWLLVQHWLFFSRLPTNATGK
jgi:hypothetical protein